VNKPFSDAPDFAGWHHGGAEEESSDGGRKVTDLALVGDALEYVEACVGGPYVIWESGRFTNSAPAWVAASPPPPAHLIRSNGGFCACIPTLMQRKAGIFEVDDTNAWYGGVVWYGEHYIDRLRVAEPFDISGNYGPGALFIRRYTGPALPGQGHVAVMSSDSMHLIQSDAFEGCRTRASTRSARWAKPKNCSSNSMVEGSSGSLGRGTG
jgi:hypothetical protein